MNHEIEREISSSLNSATGVAHITVARPERRNAMTDSMWKELEAEIRKVDDSDARVVVIQGAGDHFVAGSDLHDLAKRTLQDGFIAQAQRTTAALSSMRQVTIAAIRGAAVGGGLEVALACDLRIAADSAVFGCPELSLGMTPGAGATQRLGGLCGDGRAADLILTGRLIHAAEALQFGILAKVCHDSDLESVAGEMAERIARRDWTALQGTLLALRAARSSQGGVGLALERLAQALNFSRGLPQTAVTEILKRPQTQG